MMRTKKLIYYDGNQIHKGDRVFVENLFGVVLEVFKEGEYWESDTPFVDNCMIVALKNGKVCGYESIIIPSLKDESNIEKVGWYESWKETRFLYRGRVKHIKQSSVWVYENDVINRDVQRGRSESTN